MRVHRGHRSKTTGLIALGLVLLSGSAMGNPEFGIGNDAEYQRLVDAMRAAEYVRADSISAESPNPRVFASVAGLMAFAEINPDASDDQLALFVNLYNASLAGACTGDSMLISPEHLIAAVRFTAVSDPALAGLDTRVGERALDLLGITIPDPDGFESIQRRMVRYETALARPINQNRTEVYDLLVQGFFGQDPSGADRPGLATLLNDFLMDQGLDPAIGTVRPDRPAVEAGLSVLPTNFTDYQASISTGPMNDMLQFEVQTRLESVSTRIDALLAQIGSTLGNTPDDDTSIRDGLDATQTEIDAMLAQLQMDLEANNEARAAASAATMLMLQSQFNEIETYAVYTRDYSSIALETNDTFAVAQSSVNIANNWVNIALMSDDGAAIIDNTFSLVSETLGLVGLFDSGPSVDEQVFEQVVELRQQVEDLRIEMNERFDRIDQQLNIMFDSMIAGFNAIGDQIGDLQTDVDGLVLDMAATRSQLRRLEASLYGVAEDILLTDLTSEANIVLDYRDENGVDLPYNGGSPDFITASESFFTYANVTALSEAFAGSRSNPTLTASNANEIVGSGPVARRINDLAVLPQSFGLPALTSTDLVGIEPWSQAASAYAQLARENPWYFAFRYGRQVDDYNADPQNESLPELDRTIVSGDRLISFIEAIREVDVDGNSALFGALTDNYRNAVDSVQTEIDTIIAANIPPMFTNGSTTLDYWMQEPQNVSALLTTLGSIDAQGLSYDLPIPSSAADKGYDMFSIATSVPEVRRVQLWHLLKRQERVASGGSAQDVRARASFYTNGANGVAQIWIGDSFSNPDTTAFRTIQYSIERFFSAAQVWLPTGATDQIARDAFGEVWTEETLGASTTFDNDVASDRRSPSVGSRYNEFPFGLFDTIYRITIQSQSSNPVGLAPIQSRLYGYRSAILNQILTDLLDPGSSLGVAAAELDNAEALLDAYVSLGMPEELEGSDLLRSALRAVPGTSDCGLRSTDLIALALDMGDADSAQDWADPEFNVNHIGDVLNVRIDMIEAEIEAGLQRPARAPGYVGYMLAELSDLRDNAFMLAVDDIYTSDSGALIETDASNGLLNNDADQEFTTVLVDTLFVTDPAYIAPQHGSLTLNPDGSFSYAADPGFVGTDSFTYRATATINGTSSIAYSDPATVVLRINAPGCNNADLAAPYGELDFFDISAFLTALGAEDPIADFNNDGSYDFFDVSAFLQLLGDGCP